MPQIPKQQWFSQWICAIQGCSETDHMIWLVYINDLSITNANIEQKGIFIEILGCYLLDMKPDSVIYGCPVVWLLVSNFSLNCPAAKNPANTRLQWYEDGNGLHATKGIDCLNIMACMLRKVITGDIPHQNYCIQIQPTNQAVSRLYHCQNFLIGINM